MPEPPAAAAPPADRVAALREFNRFYTRRIGVLQDEAARPGLSLAETRVLWELAHLRGGVSAATLARELDLDPGYLSRLLKGMRQRRLVSGRPAPGDARQQLLALSAAGRRAFAPLDAAAQARMTALLAGLAEPAQQRLLQAAATIEALLGARAAPAGTLLLRPHGPGDIGWVVSRHGALYAQEYGLDLRFEALVARIAAQFIERFDARREACWIAERDGVNVGCVFLVQAREGDFGDVQPGVAQLRMLLVEPAARGLGLGARLVDECLRLARRAGYHTIRLWTQRELAAARAIYAARGWRKVGSQRHRQFGTPQVAEVWELALDAPGAPG